jgi:hypothetical protein
MLEKLRFDCTRSTENRYTKVDQNKPACESEGWTIQPHTLFGAVTRRSVAHAHGEYAKDIDADGFYEVHCNTMDCL